MGRERKSRWRHRVCGLLFAVGACDGTEDPGLQAEAQAEMGEATPADAGVRLDIPSDAAAPSVTPASDAATESSPAVDAGNMLALGAHVVVPPEVESALPGVFIPPFTSCVAPLDDSPGTGPEAQVCTQVAISGATEFGRYFPDYALCDVVRTQRPFWEAPPAAEPDPEDPRLQDEAFMTELAWAKAQIEATGCTCCHDSRLYDGAVGQWDIAAEPIWITTLSDSGLALFVGLADSSVLGAYPAADNNGFDRTQTGIPTTDTARMQAFLREEMAFRGYSEAEAEAVPPFGGPIYEASVAEPGVCGAGQGVTDAGQVLWTGGDARYVYVLEAAADNPGVPPNLDLPRGTLWRVDVAVDQPAQASGLSYGQPVAGAQQRFPASGEPTSLQAGTTYQLMVLRDVGVPITHCLFTFGDGSVRAVVSEPEADAEEEPAADQSAADPECAADSGFGQTCSSDADCSCGVATYCAIMPGQTQGTCTATGCDSEPSICPADYSCLDLSRFAPGQPAICTQ